jgi:hypothetical protein
MSEKIYAAAKGFKIVISSPYGATEGFRNGAAHTGIDIPLESDTVLQSVADGVVTKIYDGSTAIGKGVAIQTEAGRTHIYGHLNSTTVDIGDKLNAGDVIGFSGNTGNVVGANGGYHLHFAEQNVHGSFTDPTHLTDELAKMLGHGPGFWATAMEKYNAFSDKVIGSQYEFILKPIGHFFRDVSTDVWNWFVINLPDIIGYTTVGAGVIIILSSMVGRGGMLKTLGWYFGAFILAACILGGV